MCCIFGVIRDDVYTTRADSLSNFFRMRAFSFGMVEDRVLNAYNGNP